MKYAQMLDKVKQEVIRFFKANHDDGFSYHNVSHTESVVAHADELARHYQLGEKDTFIVSVAAWFHDTGYYNGGAMDHELRGADKAEFFLNEIGLDPGVIKAVRGCIMATRIPQSPQSLMEQIVCDADLYHLGTGSFAKQNNLMRQEVEWRTDKKIGKSEWRKHTITFLEAHHYQTDYGRNHLEERKRQNIEKLKQKAGKEELSMASPTTNIMSVEKLATQQKPAGKEQKNNDRPDKGIETMFRISSSNHQRLSDMADNKAHIMITTTSIIISVLLSVLLRKLEDNPHLLIPTLLLLAVCVTTMVFSILATRPKLPPGTFTQEDIRAKKVNLLFFGNFYRMNYDEYAEGIQKVMNDREFLYGSLTRDLYSQGVVLGRKYRLLRSGYNIFMYGVVASVLSFIFAVVFFK
jgi:predicted metal-dependent HD superfamily phosphohydrolase